MRKTEDGAVMYGGPRPPPGSLTLKEAQRLPGLGGKNHMTVRRALAPVRIGVWLPAGTAVWCVLYDAKKTREVASALARGAENPYRRREKRNPRQVRPLSPLPHGPRHGWATADDIQFALKEYGIDGTKFQARWLRRRLFALGLPSERRVVTRAIQVVFPFAQAIAALRADDFVLRR